MTSQNKPKRTAKQSKQLKALDKLMDKAFDKETGVIKPAIAVKDSSRFDYLFEAIGRQVSRSK